MTISATDVRRAAMDLLARREHGAKELIDKLQRRFDRQLARAKKSASPGDEIKEDGECEVESSEQPAALAMMIAEEVQRLTDSGLQSDSRLAESFVRARANRGQGPMKIRMELRQKGIHDTLIEQAFFEAEVDWQAQALAAAQKKFSRIDPSDPKQRAKRQRFLQQRGFSFDEISIVEQADSAANLSD